MVLAATVVLPLPTASADNGDWLDASFGAQGVASRPPGVIGGQFTIDPADRLIVATPVDANSTSLVRLTADGAQDLSFAGGGRNVAKRPGAVHADAGGTVSLLTMEINRVAPVVWRFTAAGEPDTSYGPDGSVSIVDTTSTVSAIGLLDRPGGGLLAVLRVVTAGGQSVTYLVALTSAGTPDTNWAPGSAQPGVLVLPNNPRAVAADGDAVVLLTETADSVPTTFLQRLTAAGAPDTTFGPGGRFDLRAASQFLPSGALAVDGGAAFVAGTLPASGRIGVAKVLANGSLDPGFGTGGIATGAPPNGCAATAVKLSARAGRVAAGGIASVSCANLLRVDRFTSTGTLDEAFGTGAKCGWAPSRARDRARSACSTSGCSRPVGSCSPPGSGPASHCCGSGTNRRRRPRARSFRWLRPGSWIPAAASGCRPGRSRRAARSTCR
jgi:uncharacterized delta-60 repeat protein